MKSVTSRATQGLSAARSKTAAALSAVGNTLRAAPVSAKPLTAPSSGSRSSSSCPTSVRWRRLYPISPAAPWLPATTAPLATIATASPVPRLRYMPGSQPTSAPHSASAWAAAFTSVASLISAPSNTRRSSLSSRSAPQPGIVGASDIPFSLGIPIVQAPTAPSGRPPALVSSSDRAASSPRSRLVCAPSAPDLLIVRKLDCQLNWCKTFGAPFDNHSVARRGRVTVVAGGRAPARPQLIRAMNEQLLLDHIRRSGKLARAELARISHLSKPTVSLALTNLERAGLVRTSGVRTGSPGPAALLYEVHPEAGYVLALDIGALFLRGAISDGSGRIRAKDSIETQAVDGHGRVAELIQLADRLCARLPIGIGDVTQTVLGSPGVYDPRRDALGLAGSLL